MRARRKKAAPVAAARAELQRIITYLLWIDSHDGYEHGGALTHVVDNLLCGAHRAQRPVFRRSEE